MQSQHRVLAIYGRTAMRTEEAPQRRPHAPRLCAAVLAAATLVALVVFGAVAAEAQTPAPTPAPFATAVATLTPDDLAPDSNLVFHGDALRVSASASGTPMPVGAPFPTGEPPLDLDLTYTEPLPGNIPSATLLGVYHYGGATWSPVPATFAATAGGGTYSVAVAKTGDYAVAAPALRIEVRPTAVTLRRGESVQFTAQVLNPQGQPQAGYTVTWQATSAAGTITPAGLFTATGRPGTYDGAVVASLGDIEGYADVTIAPWTTLVPLVLRGWEMQLRPNDPLYALQWNLVRIRAPQAWATSTGGPVIVAVIDSGVDLEHPDLQANLVSGVDYVDRLPGGLPSTNPQDENGHGTHVTGIVAAVGNNAIGVSGTAWTARVMPVRVLDKNGNGYVTDAVLAIKWAVEHGGRIINLSLGTPETDSLAVFEDAVRYAQARNVLVVAAAGNLPPFTLGQPVYPASFAGVVGVGATNMSDAVAGFSNQGPFVDVTAPGESIHSTYLVSEVGGSGYRAMNGTSMATPHVSGVAALLWSRYPQLSAIQVAAILRGSAQDFGDPGYDQAYGWGRLDAAAAMELAPRVLSATSQSLQTVEPPQAPAQPNLEGSDEPSHFRPGYLLVRAEPDVVAQARASVLGEVVAQSLSIEELLPGWSLVQVPEGQEVAIRARLAGQPGVLGVYFDALIQAMD